MAKFEEVVVFDAAATIAYDQLPVCQVKDSFVVNTSKNSVSLVQISSKKLLQTWTLKQPHIFTSPVVYSEKDDTLCAVFDKKVLVLWQCSASCLKDAQKVKFHDDIFSITTAEENIQVVVFTSGACLLFEDALSKCHLPTKKVLTEDEEIVWANCARKLNNVIVYILSRSQKDTYKLHTVLLSKSAGTVLNSSCNPVSRKNTSLRSWCVGIGKNPPFISAWSNGDICYYHEDNKPAEHILSIYITESENLVAVEAMDSSHLAVVKLESFGAKYIVIEIWDTRFSIKKAQKIIDASFSKYLQVKVLGSSLFFSSDQGIICVSCQLSFTDLAYVVGKCPVDGCVKEEKTFSWESNGTMKEIRDQESCNFSKQSYQVAFNKIISKLKEGDIEKIPDYVMALGGISECDLVMLLRIFLRMRKSCTGENCLIPVKGSDGISKFYIGKHIFALFCIPFTCAFIQEHLRKMTFQETLETLEILHCLLDVWRSHEVIPTDFDAYWPADEKIVLWVDQLMESHVNHFWTNGELVSNFITLIGILHESISERIQICDSIRESIIFIVNAHKAKSDVIEKPITNSYSIEVLHL